MNTLYKNLKKGTNWAGRNPRTARVVNILLPTLMMLSGYWMGYDLLQFGYEFSLIIPFLILAVCYFVSKKFSDNPFDSEGNRKSGQKVYMDRIIRYSVYVYSAFLIMICSGNYDFNENIYSSKDAVSDWIQVSNSANEDLYAAVEYSTAPPVERLTKTSKKMKLSKKKFRNKKSLKKQKALKLTQERKGGYLFMAIFFIFFAIVSAGGACAAFCVGGPVGIALGVFAVTSFIASIALAAIGVREYKARRRKERKTREEAKVRAKAEGKEVKTTEEVDNEWKLARKKDKPFQGFKYSMIASFVLAGIALVFLAISNIIPFLGPILLIAAIILLIVSAIGKRVRKKKFVKKPQESSNNINFDSLKES